MRIPLSVLQKTLRVLVIGDGVSLQSLLVPFLRRVELHWDVEVVMPGVAGSELVLAGHHHVVIVELSLPGDPNSLDTIRALRLTRGEVILLTLAHGGAPDVLPAAAAAGADDHLDLAHGLEEIRARIRFALMRASRHAVVRCEALELDLVEQEARIAGSVADLTKSQWLLLVRMGRCIGSPVHHAELCRFARIQRDDAWVNLRDAIRHLRARLGAAAALVQQFRGRGYGLAPASALSQRNARTTVTNVAVTTRNDFGCGGLR